MIEKVIGRLPTEEILDFLKTNLFVFLKITLVTLRLVLIALFVLSVYFIPVSVAMIRRKRSVLAIFVANLLFGWTLIGWGVSLVWSLTKD